MKATERIKEIDDANRTNGPFPDPTKEFLLKAFKVMRSIAVDYSKAIDPDDTRGVEALLDYEFEGRMAEPTE